LALINKEVPVHKTLEAIYNAHTAMTDAELIMNAIDVSGLLDYDEDAYAQRMQARRARRTALAALRVAIVQADRQGIPVNPVIRFDAE
jgi:hypothetical protein